MVTTSLEQMLREEVVEKETVTLRLPKNLLADIDTFQKNLAGKKVKISKSKIYEVLLRDALKNSII
jgi:hypothetical protein